MKKIISNIINYIIIKKKVNLLHSGFLLPLLNMNNQNKITYVKIDEFDYAIYEDGVKTDKIVTSFCEGCAPILLGEGPQPNQMAHYDGCLGDNYYNDGRYDIIYDTFDEHIEEKEDQDDIQDDLSPKKRCRTKK